ncbi:hypothetical protein [Desulfobacter curvatus]|uniref:hypothetical protein n=1 Tax=Desulfobacter curvatus TaxID=2290 RepID=UPI0012FC3BEB|nr:hypothetical protein [Desulfobacter curvatus]
MDSNTNFLAQSADTKCRKRIHKNQSGSGFAYPARLLRFTVMYIQMIFSFNFCCGLRIGADNPDSPWPFIKKSPATNWILSIFVVDQSLGVDRPRTARGRYKNPALMPKLDMMKIHNPIAAIQV